MLLLRSLAAIALLVVGGGGALAATLVHASWWGLVLGLGAAAVSTVALPGGWRFAFMFGWFAALVLAVQTRPEGDYLIAADEAGYGLLGGSFVLFLISLATLARSASRRRASDGDPGVSPP